MDDLSVAVEAARAAGAVVAADFSNPGPPDMKGRGNPVTETDRRAEAAIAEILHETRPADAVLGEEGGEIRAGDDAAARQWIVDPLDGTVNFVHGIPQVAVSVALYVDRHPQVGVVLDPLRDELFTAVAGGGARLNDEPMSVSEVASLSDALVATGFPYDRHVYAGDYTKSVTLALERATGVRRAGSAALDFAWLAAGRLDAYWEFVLAPWDIAAGVLLVREAGGKSTDGTGGEASPWHQVCVSSNGRLHEPLLQLVADAMPAHLAPDTS